MSAPKATALYWDKIEAYLSYACALFGLPQQLAHKLWLTRAEHKRIADFLRPLEELARRLIFIAALKLAQAHLPPAPERKFRPARGFPANSGAAFDPDRPESWRVGFKLDVYHQPHSAPASKRAGGACAPRRLSSAPCALRLEALIRVFAQRDTLAAALARKIARNARAAHAYITRPSAKLAHKPVYVTLFDLIPHAQDAYQHFIMNRLDQARPDSS